MRLGRSIIYFRKTRCQGELGVGNAELFGIWKLEGGSRKERIKNNFMYLPEISEFTKHKTGLIGSEVEGIRKLECGMRKIRKGAGHKA